MDEITPKDKAEELTEHLNNTNPLGSIKFTFEKEQERKLPFLDIQQERLPDKTIKATVFRKKTHRDQYLNFNSHHLLHQTLGVVRSLLDRKDCVITTEEDKQVEEKHTEKALGQCNYPKWSTDLAKQQKERKKVDKEANQRREKQDPKDKKVVVISYTKGLSEQLSKV